jgi:hypothetical protein
MYERERIYIVGGRGRDKEGERKGWRESETDCEKNG